MKEKIERKGKSVVERRNHRREREQEAERSINRVHKISRASA
jgi:hypothetical protein